MSHTIDAHTLADRLEEPNLCIFDLRFSLEKPDQGRCDFAAGHIPGARYLHMNQDLSAPIIAGQTGRHPLPAADAMQQLMRRCGVNDDTLVVVYDDGPGLFAARLWWMLHWLGHEQVRVLNGGLAAWQALELPLSTATPRPVEEGNFNARPDNSKLISAEELLQRLNDPSLHIIDARGQARFNGEVEPIDPVAGHIPGASCLPCLANVDSDGYWQEPEQLRERFKPWLEHQGELACYCGSGVTACHNILAALLAGLPEPRLYAGSWSEWITDPTRPVATGAD